MSIVTKPRASLEPGREIRVFSEAVVGPGIRSESFSISSDSVLVSLFVKSIDSGTLIVTVFTVGTDGQELSVIQFPVITAPSIDLLLKKAATTLTKLRIDVTYTGDCEFEIRAKGLSGGISSVKIENAASITASQTNVTTTPSVLIPSSLVDRAGLIIMNYSLSSVMYIGGTLAEADTAIGYPIPALL